jgi:predicted DNA-binding transcriptional regulator AlpA
MGQRLKTPATSEYTGLSTSCLEKYRHYGGGPNFLKLGRAVVYDTDDLDRWLESRKRISTSDTGNGER